VRRGVDQVVMVDDDVRSAAVLVEGRTEMR
jgi:hypothetical protein